jgi:acyl carrier protein
MNQEIVCKLREIIKKLLGNAVELENDFDDSILHVILSESSQALEFICLIEDEFEIEFDDDDIDIDFFQSIDTIANRIVKCLQTKIS